MGGAKNCPETPRQKMIGMMYLVLTAMLALNVSADILNGFTKLRNSMDASMRATKLRTEDVMINFQAAYEKDGGEKKYGDWWAIAQAVNTSSNDFYDYIDQFKLDIINMIDGKEYASMAEVEKVDNNGDTNKPHQYALNEKNPENGKIHADEFKEKMDAFRTYVTVVESPCLLNKIARDPKFSHEWDMKVKMMSDLFSTDDVDSKEGDGKISWQQSTFDEMPAGAVLALLTKYQNDVRVAQNDLINFMFSAAGSSDFSVNSVEAVVLARNGSYVMQGQHFVADIYSAMVDTNQRPRVFINGQELEGGRYDVVASGVGPHTFSGYMLIGDDTTHYAIPTQTYTVGAPSATISNIEMNVMYRGYDNKFSVSVPGRSAEQVKVTCSNATVSKNGANWIIVPGSGDKSVIEVFAEVDGHSTSMGKQEFRVKNLPDPKLYFENGNSQFKNGQQVSRKIMTDANSRVTAGFGKDVELQANLKVTGFSLKVGSKIIQVSGDKLSGPALAEVKKLRAGDMVRILGVKVQGPKGPVGNEKENNILLELN